jgi:hypothetical protein
MALLARLQELPDDLPTAGLLAPGPCGEVAVTVQRRLVE